MKRVSPNRARLGRRRRPRGYVLLTALFFAGVVLAFGGTVQSPSASGNDLDWVATVVRLLVATAGVLALAWGGLWLLRRVLLEGRSRVSREWIDVLATAYIAPKKQINLVKVLDKFLVIGVTEAGMNTLAELDEESVSRHITPARGGSGKQSGFARLLKGALASNSAAVR